MTDFDEELYSLLVPIADTRLIVPRVCVAEVTGLGQLQMLDRATPAAAVAAEEKNWRDGAPVVCRIRMINEYPLVPDLEQLESMLFDARDHWA